MWRGAGVVYVMWGRVTGVVVEGVGCGVVRGVGVSGVVWWSVTRVGVEGCEMWMGAGGGERVYVVWRRVTGGGEEVWDVEWSGRGGMWCGGE